MIYARTRVIRAPTCPPKRSRWMERRCQVCPMSVWKEVDEKEKIENFYMKRVWWKGKLDARDFTDNELLRLDDVTITYRHESSESFSVEATCHRCGTQVQDRLFYHYLPCRFCCVDGGTCNIEVVPVSPETPEVLEPRCAVCKRFRFWIKDHESMRKQRWNRDTDRYGVRFNNTTPPYTGANAGVF